MARGELADARAKGIPAIVVGSRDLNSRFQPSLNVATDGDVVAQAAGRRGRVGVLLRAPRGEPDLPDPERRRDHDPGLRDRHARLPLGAREHLDGPDAVFGDAGLLLAEVDVAKRDPATNRAPVSVRLVPIVSELTLQAVDGTLLRRSRPSLFQGLGRRPAGGDRWGRGGRRRRSAAAGLRSLHDAPRRSRAPGPACTTRITPEYEFTSSDPDIGDFVAQDPASTNLRKPLIGADDKVVTDRRSGLFCPFNAGKTTITVKAGGLAYSTEVTVQAGLRPAAVRHPPAGPVALQAARGPGDRRRRPPPAAAAGPGVGADRSRRRRRRRAPSARERASGRADPASAASPDRPCRRRRATAGPAAAQRQPRRRSRRRRRRRRARSRGRSRPAAP